ncbi:hypothetical protein D3C85_1460590 [compost metagenome]
MQLLKPILTNKYTSLWDRFVNASKLIQLAIRPCTRFAQCRKFRQQFLVRRAVAFNHVVDGAQLSLID